MKAAAPPCGFNFYNKDNPDGSAPDKYAVTGSAAGGESGALSEVFTVAGKKLYIDGVSVAVDLSVTDPLSSFAGTASATFAFPAMHFGLLLDGHATLAEKDVVTQTVAFSGMIAAFPAVLPYAVTGEIVSVGQDILDDWSET